MLRKLYIFSFLISTLMFISCDRDNGIGDTDLLDGAISFSSTIIEADWSAVRNIKHNAPNTRGSISNIIPSIGVIAFWSTSNFDDVANSILPNLMYNQLLSNSGGNAWTTSPTFYWPMGGNQSSFFAYSPYASDAANNGITISEKTAVGVPIITYKMPVNVLKQPDLIIADAHKDIKYTEGATTIALKFEHALAAIGFNLEGSGGEILSSIVVKNIIDQGSIQMRDLINNSWNLSSTISTQLYYVGLMGGGPITASSSQTNIMADDGYLMVIPQTDLSNSVVVAIIDDVEYNISFPNGGKWERGTRYRYNIIISVLNDVTVTIEDWTEEGVDDGVII